MLLFCEDNFPFSLVRSSFFASDGAASCFWGALLPNNLACYFLFPVVRWGVPFTRTVPCPNCPFIFIFIFFVEWVAQPLCRGQPVVCRALLSFHFCLGLLCVFAGVLADERRSSHDQCLEICVPETCFRVETYPGELGIFFFFFGGA